MRLTYCFGFVFLACIMGGGCSRKLKDCQNLKADNPEIIKFANECVKGSRDLTKYEYSAVTETPEYWRVLYKRKSNDKGLAPLGGFGFIIDRKTCKGELIPGG